MKVYEESVGVSRGRRGGGRVKAASVTHCKNSQLVSGCERENLCTALLGKEYRAMVCFSSGIEERR